MMRLVSEAPDQDHQHPEHERSRRHRRHRVPEEHRLRQLLERGAHASGRQVAHLLRRRHAGHHRARALENGAADHGRPARVWHGGPFARTTSYVFYPSQIMFGTDPVAIDRLLLDIIEDKRKAEGVISIWDRSPALAQDGRHARARRRSERQHHHQGAGARRVRRRRSASASTIVRRSGAGHHGMTGPLVVVAAFLSSCPPRPPARASTGRRASTAGPRSKLPASGTSASPRIRSTPGAPRLLGQASATQDLASREALPAPGIAPRAGVASPTRAPWIVASGWRFVRSPRASFVYELPSGKAALAAAEAFAYGADAVLKVDPADLESLGAHADVSRSAAGRRSAADRRLRRRRRWLAGDRRGHEPADPAQPAVSGRQSAVGAVPNSTSPSAARYPLAEAADPSAFAQKVRAS